MLSTGFHKCAVEFVSGKFPPIEGRASKEQTGKEQASLGKRFVEKMDDIAKEC